MFESNQKSNQTLELPDREGDESPAMNNSIQESVNSRLKRKLNLLS